METLSPAMNAQKGLRAQILLELKKSQPLTVRDLAEKHRVSANAIRRHLKELEAEQLIAYIREQRGIGAPTFAYRLTSFGEGLFPKRYAEQLTDVLTYLEQRGGREEVRRFFTERFQSQTQVLLAQLQGSSFQERVEAVGSLFREQGVMAGWALIGGAPPVARGKAPGAAAGEK